MIIIALGLFLVIGPAAVIALYIPATFMALFLHPSAIAAFFTLGAVFLTLGTYCAILGKHQENRMLKNSCQFCESHSSNGQACIFSILVETSGSSSEMVSDALRNFTPLGVVKYFLLSRSCRIRSIVIKYCKFAFVCS